MKRPVVIVGVASMVLLWATSALAADVNCDGKVTVADVIAAIFTDGVPPCQRRLPGTGQVTCWNSLGEVIPCAGTRQDGDLQAGATLLYTDNADGTITDTNTALMWEKKDDNNLGGDHDVDDRYSWADALSVFVERLNNRCKEDESVACATNGDADCSGVGGPCGFAGYRDWRMPNVKELESLVHYGIAPPGLPVDPVFSAGCTPGCRVPTCSCTQPGGYWSSTTNASSPRDGWLVWFDSGSVNGDGKLYDYYVRAVRGGL